MDALFHRAGYLDGPVPLYYEGLGPDGDGDRPLIVLVHGGGFSGSCYLSTPDGRPGWAADFARHGYRVVVPDWPGVGRSAGIAPDDVSVVTSPYRVDGEVVGTVGVIGPTRMAYERVVPIVDVTAKLLSSALSKH